MPASHTMQYVRLGNSGLKISKVVLGCMSFGSPEWVIGGGNDKWVLDEATSLPLIKHAYDLGINTFDTADVYSNGESERVLGQAIRHYQLPRDNLVIATKLHGRVSHTVASDGFGTRAEAEANGYVNQQGLSRKHIFAAVDASLERLGLAYIDLLQCHRFDPDTPVEETMQALHDVVQSGRVRYIGMSSCYAYQFHTMQAYADKHNLVKFVSMQNFHNAAYREEEREMLPLCRQLGVGCIPWSPLCMGLLARPSDAGKTARNANRFFPATFSRESEPIVSKIAEIAEARGTDMATVAIAWSLGTPGISAPIIGGSKASHITSAAEAIHFVLSDDERKSISDLYTPKAIFGHGA